MQGIPEGELLYGIRQKINYHLTKDIFGQKSIGREATNCKPWKIVELLSWLQRQKPTQDILPVYSNCVTYEPSKKVLAVRST